MSDPDVIVVSDDEEGGHDAGEARTPAPPKTGSVVVIDSSPEDVAAAQPPAAAGEAAGTVAATKFFLVGTPTNGDALSVLVSKLQNAGGTTVAFVTGYFPRKEQPHFVVACGPGTYADDIARGRVQLSSLSLWKNADGSIRRICGESDIVPLCEDSCSPAELAALKKALAKPPPGSTGKRGSDAGAAGGGTGSTPAKRRSTGEGAAGAAAAASPSASVLVVDLFALVRESRQASLAPLLATNGAARNKIIARLERVLAAVGSRASEEAACNKFGAPYIKKLFPATHKALLIEVLNLPSTQQLCAPANEN